jgi:hypothetical protein
LRLPIIQNELTIFRAHVSRTRRLPLMTVTGFARFIMCGHKLFKRRWRPSHLNTSAVESSHHQHQLARFCCREVVCLSPLTFECFVVSRSCSLAPMLGIMPCDVLHLAQARALHLAQARAQRVAPCLSFIVEVTPTIYSPTPPAPPQPSPQPLFNLPPSLKTFATPIRQVLLT